MRELLIRFAAWRADVARQLNEILLWREITEFCRRISLPLTVLARGTLRVFPFLRRLEWLLEIDALARRHPVMLVATLAFVLLRGLKTTPLGHIATDKAIYPFVALISGYNPFLGMLCGIFYGAGDLVQKFFLPDIYGARHWSDMNFWGAMAGYVVAYSSLMIMGLAPGMASRACRAAAGAMIRSYFRRRATAMADGGVPLPVSPAPLVEMAAGAVGAFAAGWTVLHEVAPVTERPAFYWRPQPDVSCHNLEVATHLQKPAPTVGGVAAAGAAIPVLAPPPPPPLAPPQAPQYPDEIEWTAPDGKRHVLVKNEQGQYINILTGGMVDVTQLDAWKQSWSNIIADHQQFSQQQMQKLENRDTAFDKEMDAWVAAQKEKDKIWQNLSKMEQNILFGSGPESNLYKPSGEPGNILDHIHNLQDQIIRGKPLDKEKYQQIFHIYKGVKQGDILTENQLPTSGEITRDIINNTLKSTAKEFILGEKSDGSISWLGLTGRTLTATVTGGLSEIVFTPAEALKNMKDYVDAGGKSIIGGFASSAGAVLAGEIFGKAGELVGAGIQKVSAAAGKAAGEFLENAAKKGSTAAQQVLDAAGSAKKGLSNLASSIQDALQGKPASTGTKMVDPPLPPRTPGQQIRDTARAGTTSVEVVHSGLATKPQLAGYPDNALKHAKQVSDKYGVVLDLRPTNAASKPLIEAGEAVPKASFVKNKSLTPEDMLLGAKGKPGMIGHYDPVLPPKGNMSDESYEKLKDLYNKRKSEFAAEAKAMQDLQTQGKAYVKDGVIHDAKTGKPFAGDIDIFEIRDPVTGKPLPRYQVDHKGNLIIDPATGQPKLNPVREQIIKELKNGPFQAQHGAHMDWKYDHLPSSAHDAGIDKGVISKHQIGQYKPGGGGKMPEELVSVGPNGKLTSSVVRGGR